MIDTRVQLYGQQQQATDLVAHVRFLTRSSAATTSVVAVTSVVSIKVGPRRQAVYYSDENFMGLSRDTSSNSTTQDRTYVSHTHTCTPSTTQDRTYVTHTQLYTTLNEHLGFSRAFFYFLFLFKHVFLELLLATRPDILIFSRRSTA